MGGGERIVACVGPDRKASVIVRRAWRLANLMHAPWIAVRTERPSQPLSDEERRWVDRAMKLAKDLGGETKVLAGTDIAGDLLRFAKFENVTQIVIGRSYGGFLATMFRTSLTYELVRRSEDIAIHIVTRTRKRRRWSPLRRHLRRALVKPLPFVWTTVAAGAATLVGEVLSAAAPAYDMSMVFLMAVLFSAVNFGAGPAIYASVISLLAYKLLFIEPLYSLAIPRPYEIFTLAVFLGVALIVSGFAGRVREQATATARRVKSTRRLYMFTRKLSAQTTLDAVAEAAATEICAHLGRPSLVLLENKAELELRASWPPEDQIDTASLSAARWAFSHDEPAGAGTKTLPLTPWFFLPLRTSRGRVGVLGVACADEWPPLEPEARALLDALAEQTAAALERAALTRDMVDAQTQAETERVRNTLLASISQDFQTPLTSILGSVTTVLNTRDALCQETRKELLQQIRQEAENLDGKVRNLLTAMRIDAGGLELFWDWVDLREIAERVVSRARRRGATQRMVIDLPADLPLVRGDPILVEQALGNVAANAMTHTPHNTPVVIDAVVTPATISVRITDRGAGVPADVLSQAFKKFFPLRRPPVRAAGKEGAGLGLANAKGIMEAHGGSIAAESPVADGHGARIVLSFPRTGNCAGSAVESGG